MSKKAVYNILTRAFLDPGFRQELERDINAAAKRLGEELSPEELEEVRLALVEEAGGTATGLDQRLSKSGVSLSPQAMLRQKGASDKRELRADKMQFKRQKTKSKSQSKINDGNIKDDEESSFDVTDYDADEPDYEVERG